MLSRIMASQFVGNRLILSDETVDASYQFFKPYFLKSFSVSALVVRFVYKGFNANQQK